MDSTLKENKVSSGAVFLATEAYKFQMIYAKPESMQFVDKTGKIN